MSETHERIQKMMFELGDLKGRARTSEEYELADASLTALRAKWEAFCKKQPIIAQEIKPKEVRPWL